MMGTCRACGQELVDGGDRIWHPWNLDISACAAKLPIGDTGFYSGDVSRADFVPSSSVSHSGGES